MRTRDVATAVLAFALTGCGSAQVQAPVQVPVAEQALADVGRPSSASFEHGSFDFSRQIKGVGNEDDDRLASMSWDIYYVLDDGDVGAWGAGMDVFGSAEAARESAEELATFWVCDGPREPVEVEDPRYDLLEASTCKRPTGVGYYATLSAADGLVTANLAVASRDRGVATAALVAVWAEFSVSAQQVVDHIS
ncbi:hypothetical protein [Nocardioides dilutus]